MGGSETFSCDHAGCVMHGKEADRDAHSTVNIYTRALLTAVTAHKTHEADAAAAVPTAESAAAVRK